MIIELGQHPIYVLGSPYQAAGHEIVIAVAVGIMNMILSASRHPPTPSEGLRFSSRF